MSGINSSDPGNAMADSPLRLTVHSMPAPTLDDTARRTAGGRWKMLAILAVCAAPVIASYVAYFVVKPQGRSNYGELIMPSRELPQSMPLVALTGEPVSPASLAGQWLLVVVSDAACDAVCEKHLFLQRQLRETLGRDNGRLDKVWLVTDDAALRPEVLHAVSQGTPVTVLRVPRHALSQWLEPAAGHALRDHLYIVDPMGHWMMRTPADPDPSKVKRDIERLLRASASWDRPGR
jgi:hypothetical protein